MHSKIEHVMRYTGANLASTVVDYTVYLTLTHIFGMPVLQSIFGYSAAVIVNYGLIKKFVFVEDMSHKSEHRLFMEFVGTGFIGLVITAAVVWFTTHVMNLPPVDGKTISLVICFVVLYFVRRHVVFNANTTDSAAA